MAGLSGASTPACPPKCSATVSRWGWAKARSRPARERYPAATVTGLDLPDPALASEEVSGASSGCSVHIARLPFPSGAFDLVLAIEVLEHVPDPAAAGLELGPRSRGDLVVSVPREPIWRSPTWPAAST